MTRRAGIYTRISHDDGSALGVERQRQDCMALAERLGWQVAEVLTDNDTSNFTRKPRPAYQRLLAGLESGRLNALLVWDTDRLTRHPVELEAVIDLAESHGVALASVGGEIDLATPQGRMTARIKATVSRHEVEQSSRRIKRAVLQRAQEGRPHGRVAYGWHRAGGKDVVYPPEAGVVREASERIAAGESVRSIILDFGRRGIPTPAGKRKWHPVTLRQIVMRARNAGLRLHQRQIIGSGEWEPIVSLELWTRVCAVLNDPTRKTSPHNRRKYLLSGLALCGVCGCQVRILVSKTRALAYVCPECFGVRRKQSEVDSLVRDLVIGRLSQPDVLQALVPDSEDVHELVEQAATLRARLDFAADQYSDELLDGSQLARITAKLRPRLTELENQIKEQLGTPDLADLAGPDITNRWEGLPLERRRAVIDLLMQIRIMPVGKHASNAFAPQSVEVTWRRPATLSAS